MAISPAHLLQLPGRRTASMLLVVVQIWRTGIGTWMGSHWQPQGSWESSDGNFSSRPAVVSWGSNRPDIFGITPDGTVRQKYWDGTK